MLIYPALEVPQITAAAHSVVNRDPYSGFAKVFSMPGSRMMLDQEGGSGRASNHYSEKKQVGEILKDRSQQSRVVDNVMNFFRYKDPEKYGGLAH